MSQFFTCQQVTKANDGLDKLYLDNHFSFMFLLTLRNMMVHWNSFITDAYYYYSSLTQVDKRDSFKHIYMNIYLPKKGFIILSFLDFCEIRNIIDRYLLLLYMCIICTYFPSTELSNYFICYINMFLHFCTRAVMHQ